MRVMSLTPVHPSAAARATRGHQPVVQFEGRAGQAGAVDGEIGALPGPETTEPGQVVQRLGGGQDAVAVRQGRP